MSKDTTMIAGRARGLVLQATRNGGMEVLLVDDGGAFTLDREMLESWSEDDLRATLGRLVELLAEPSEHAPDPHYYDPGLWLSHIRKLSQAHQMSVGEVVHALQVAEMRRQNDLTHELG